MSEKGNLGVDCPVVVLSVTREVSLWAEAQIQSTRSLKEKLAQLGAVIFLGGSMLVNGWPVIR